jgi:alpha-beta hydrolase superfamily lysophospholipase
MAHPTPQNFVSFKIGGLVVKSVSFLKFGVMALALTMSDPPRAIGANPYAAARPNPEDCGVARSDYPSRMGKALDLEYRIKTFGTWGIRGFEGPASNAPIFIEGNENLVVLYHGFMASPPEMLPLGRQIHEALGASVYIPLIPGFGANVEVSQLYRFSDWEQAVEESLRWARHCFSRVYVVGYSVGGGLIAHHVLAPDHGTVDGQVLLSPFFKGAAWQQTWAGAVATKGFLAILKSLFRFKMISLEKIASITRGKYRDLRILLQDPAIYDQSFALQAGMNISDLTRALKSIPNRRTSDVPTAVAISASDQTISRKYALKFSERHFSDLRSTLVLAEEEQIPHEIVVPHDELNPAFGRIAEWVVAQLLTMTEPR